MKIAINTRLLLKNKLEGIGWFTLENFKRIVINHPEHDFYFIFDRMYSKEYIFVDNVHPVIIYPPTVRPMIWIVWFELFLPLLLKILKPDIYVSPDGNLSLYTDIPQISVIHDINFYHRPDDLPLSYHLNQNVVLLFHFGNGNQVAGNGLAVECDFFDAFLDAGAVHHLDVQRLVPEPARGGESLPRGGNAGINAQAVVVGPDAQDVLGRGVVSPGGGAGKPGDARSAGALAENAVGVLRIDVGLTAADLGLFVE